jgi:hypothetical protein
MKVILNKILKNKAIFYIEEIGQGVCEILIDMELSFGTCNSIEYVKSEGNIYIHIFEENDYDLVIDFDDLEELDKIEIIKILKTI